MFDASFRCQPDLPGSGLYDNENVIHKGIESLFLMHWLNQLIEVPFLTILSTDGKGAELDVAGLKGIARCYELGVCVGLRLPVVLDERRLREALLQMVAVRATHDALSSDGHGLILWRFHPHLGTNVAGNAGMTADAGPLLRARPVGEKAALLREWRGRLEAQMSVVRRLARSQDERLGASVSAAAAVGSVGVSIIRSFA